MLEIDTLSSEDIAAADAAVLTAGKQYTDQQLGGIVIPTPAPVDLTPYSTTAQNDRKYAPAATTYTEAEVDQAIKTAIAAIPPAPGPAPQGASFGVVFLSTFAGGTDDVKLDAALGYAKGQAHIPWVTFDGNFTLNAQHVPFDGMKLSKSAPAEGNKNLELAGGKYVDHVIKLGSKIGVGTAALFHSTATIYNVTVSGLAFQGSGVTSGQQFWSQPGGTLYTSTFHNLTFYGVQYPFGNNTDKCLITFVQLTGEWEAMGSIFHFGGSDSDLWVAGSINMGTNTSSPSTPYFLWIDGLGKSTVGDVYITCGAGGYGLRVRGNGDGSPVTIRGARVEGYKNTSPATELILVDGGNVIIENCWLAYSATYVRQTGGCLILDKNTFGVEDTSGNAKTAPVLIQTGGTAIVSKSLTSKYGTVTVKGPNIVVS